MINNGVQIVSLTEKISLMVKESVEDFIIETIEPYCSELAEIKISKEELKNLILKNYGTPKTGHWIPVSERLPEKYEEVIVTDIETSDTYLSRYIGNGYWECDNGLFKNRIIAWQPKPKPYKAESEK